jgi:hypothetical protein
MKRIVLSLALAALLVPLMGAFEPAEASSRWFAGVEFSVGGLGFSLGYSDFDRHRYGPSYGPNYGPNYFYRTSRHLSYRGYSCGSACYLRDNYYYHHRECPLVLHHFSHNRFDPYSVWAGLPYGGYYYSRPYYGPYRPGYYNYRSRGHDHRRYETYRYDKRRYDHRRYDYRGRHDYRRDHDGDSDSDSDRWRRDDRGRHGNDSGRYERRDDHRSDRGRAYRSRSKQRRD